MQPGRSCAKTVLYTCLTCTKPILRSVRAKVSHSSVSVSPARSATQNVARAHMVSKEEAQPAFADLVGGGEGRGAIIFGAKGVPAIR
jgi:hypothetical protein